MYQHLIQWHLREEYQKRMQLKMQLKFRTWKSGSKWLKLWLIIAHVITMPSFGSKYSVALKQQFATAQTTLTIELLNKELGTWLQLK